MTDELMDALGKAVEGKVCGINKCQKRPRATRNGQALCAWHRDCRDHGRMGKPCDRCGSRHWVDYPDSDYPTCRMCRCNSMQKAEDVFIGSWEESE